MTPEQAKKLGNYLRQARRSKGLTTEELATSSGVNRTTVVRLEAGSLTEPKAGTLTAVAEALRVPLADVFAQANYVAPAELPSFTPYLRAKYGELPEDAVRQMERYFTRLARKYGCDPDGPPLGADET
jgi:transcriptional regulator with XRE-family HTH domain